MEIFSGGWEEMERAVACCRRCRLCEARTHTAFGEGSRSAAAMLVGEGPGREEDVQGRPFVGPAGQLLDRMLSSIGVRRDELYITNVVKCRPPGNRNPADDEAMACLPYLRRQFALVRPRILVCLGAVAARYLYDPYVRISRERGRWKERGGVLILPTYHPAALLRDESKKREAWEDMQSFRSALRSVTEHEGGRYVRTFQVGEHQE